jgi:ribosomal protein S12 methylthiotransferase accessory factor
MAVDVARTPAEVAAPPGPARVWAADGAAFADRVNERLAGRSERYAGLRVAVAMLRVRDELAVDEPAMEHAAAGTFPVHLDGASAILGPVHRTGSRRPCSRCLARRWQLVRATTLREGLELGANTGGAGEFPFATTFAVDAVASCVIAIVESAAHATTGTSAGTAADADMPAVFVLDLVTLRSLRVRLIADADCPSCGTQPPDSAAHAVMRLSPQPKPDPDTYRSRPLSGIEVPIEAYVNEVCGVLGRGFIRELDLPSTSTVIGSIAGRAAGDLYEIFWGGHANSYRTSLQVGIFEGLERYSGMRPRAVRPSVEASMVELRRAGQRVLDPRDCGVYSDDFYATDAEAVPFHEERALPWVWGFSLRDREPVLVPQALTYYHSTTQAQRFVQECSNGCASGSSLVEASYYGLVELIERDAFLISWYGRAPLPEIDPRTSRRPQTRAMVDRLRMYGYTARFFDGRLTFALPVVVGVAVRDDGGVGTMCFGGGASLDPEQAMAAALVEIGTDCLHLARRTRADEKRLRRMAADFDQVLGLDDHPRLYGLPEMARYASFLLDRRGPMRDLDELRVGGPPGSVDLTEDLLTCVDMVTSAGFDTIVVDQTSPEQRPLGLHTASVIVPGLVPIDFGWRRQRARHLDRTRTALTKAGLRQRDLSADDLNPSPHPFP